MRHTSLDGLGCQHPVCPRPSQVAHAHGRDPKRQTQVLAQKRLGQQILLCGRKHAGHQTQTLQCGQVVGGSRFIANGTVDVIKNDAGQSSMRLMACVITNV